MDNSRTAIAARATLIAMDPDLAAAVRAIATFGQLRGSASRRAIEAAVRAGELQHCWRGNYVLATASPHLKAAADVHGVASHLSAAILHGWAVKHEPQQPFVTVPRHRTVRSARAAVRVSWRDLPQHEVSGGVTSARQTVLDCARTLAFDEALCVADSALRARDVSRSTLRELADQARGPGSAQVRAVCAAADGRSANVFESVLRAICLGVPGLCVEPQHQIADDGVYAVVDLADRRLGIVIEAEGFETHGTRHGFDKDVARYTALAAHGWLIVRFTWPEVMFRPNEVRQWLERAVAERTGHSEWHNAAAG